MNYCFFTSTNKFTATVIVVVYFILNTLSSHCYTTLITLLLKAVECICIMVFTSISVLFFRMKKVLHTSCRAAPHVVKSRRQKHRRPVEFSCEQSFY